jgi:16S rRNA (adenine1518-N6/adenine1519-N6)-dimethyltransferase
MVQMDDAKSPSHLLRRYGLRPKKSWGQCFLKDPQVVQRIVEVSGISEEKTVVEVGAGLGTLTFALARKAGRLVAIERDRDLAHVLRQELLGHANVEVCEANALTFPFEQFESPVTVVGNLPYNIATPILFYLLERREKIASATLMLQKELAARLAAGPNSKTYGAPSVICQNLARVSLCFFVDRTAFVPRPQVDSAVIRLDMLDEPRVKVKEELFRAIVRAAFNQRRKTLRRALLAAFSPALVEASLEQAAIDGGRRGENLNLEEFGALAQCLDQLIQLAP